MPVTPAKPGARIFLIRHGQPKVSQAGWFSLAGARQFILDYDAAAVEDFDRTLAGISVHPGTPVYCSPLERSRDTARKLFGSAVSITEDAQFREFERSIPALPFLWLPIAWWTRLARIFWFLGIRSREVESFSKARVRANAAAGLLAEQAARNGQVVLVAHGMLNHFIGRALKRRGWKNVQKAKRGYLGVAEWEKLS